MILSTYFLTSIKSLAKSPIGITHSKLLPGITTFRWMSTKESQDFNDPTFLDKCLETLKSAALGNKYEESRNFPFATAKEIANEYIMDENYGDDNEKRIADLVSWERGKTMGSAFVTGVGGVVSLPLLPAALISSLIYQARLSGGIAEIRGYDTHQDDVQTAVIVSLMGTNINKITQQLDSRVAYKTFTEFGTLRLPIVGMATIQRMVIRELAKQGSVKASARGGARALPLLGGIVGSLVDAHSLEKTKDNALRIFNGTQINQIQNQITDIE